MPGRLQWCGTIFKITSHGQFETLHSFNGSDGAHPHGSLMEAADGNLYGTTASGGNFACAAPYGCGTVFRVTPRGKLTVLHAFEGTDGALSWAALTQADDGNFYGTTQGGGEFGWGTVFEITPQGHLTSLHSFEGDDGINPSAGLTRATDGNLYGTASTGGATNHGTVFKILSDGTFLTLPYFDSATVVGSQSALVQATDGTFYSTTGTGGNYGDGSVFRLSLGFDPFVTFVRATGKVGQTGGILGQGFTGTTSVTLNGTAVSFTVVSDTFIKATVPSGATTGYVMVATPSGTLQSNVPFRVIP